MVRRDQIGFEGVLRMTLRAQYPERVRIQTTDRGRWTYDEQRNLFVIEEANGVPNLGLQLALDRLFGLGGVGAVSHIGVSSNNTAVTSATTFLNGASGGAAANTIIKALSPAASRSNQTVTAGATFQNADFTSGLFVVNKIGFLNTSTDAGTGLLDVIGGSGGSDPFSRTFVVDFTNAGTFTLVPQIAFTAYAVKAAFPSPL